jgi:hypothetical protein
MAGLVPAGHVFAATDNKDVDARHKAGHDGEAVVSPPLAAAGSRYAASFVTPAVTSSWTAASL